MRHLLGPVDAAWLAAFRALFGITLAVSMWRFLANDWVRRFFVEPRFHFKYWGFEWVEPLPEPALTLLVTAVGALSLLLAAGLMFRLSALLVAVGLTYLQLIDVSTYLNHYYLAALLAWLLALSPAGRCYSADAALLSRLRKTEEQPWCARGWLYLFRFQVGIVYAGAALAKFQGDWLLHAQPLRIWLAASAELPVIGPLLAVEGVPLIMSWCGFLFDLTIVLWLSSRRARPIAYAVLLLFHVLTRLLFPIGMFPVIMTVGALAFFEPNWPRALVSRWLRRSAVASVPESRELSPARAQRAAVLLGLAYCAVQFALPLRHWVYGGNVLWHEQGMRFSWRVMVRAKGGSTTFVVRNKLSGKTWHVSPSSYLTALQEDEMASQPDLILQLAHQIGRDAERRGLGPVEVRAESLVSLNGRRSAPLIDPAVDLLTIHDGVEPKAWVLEAPRTPPPPTRVVL
jgi:hypothetical protein